MYRSVLDTGQPRCQKQLKRITWPLRSNPIPQILWAERPSTSRMNRLNISGCTSSNDVRVHGMIQITEAWPRFLTPRRLPRNLLTRPWDTWALLFRLLLGSIHQGPKKKPKAKKSHEQNQRIFWTIPGHYPINKSFQANRTRKFTR